MAPPMVRARVAACFPPIATCNLYSTAAATVSRIVFLGLGFVGFIEHCRPCKTCTWRHPQVLGSNPRLFTMTNPARPANSLPKRRINDHDELQQKTGAVKEKEIPHALPEAEPAQSDSFIDLDSLIKETCASVKEHVRRIKQSKRDHASSPQPRGKKKKDAKKVRRNTDRDIFDSKSEVAKDDGERSEEEKSALKQQYLALEATSRYLDFMTDLYATIITALKENPTFKN